MVARVQNNGLARITSLLAAAAWWLQWGTGSAAAATANVVTTTTTTEARSSATPTQGTTTVTNDKLVLTGTITAAGTRAITEVGAFDAVGTGSPPTGGNMNIYADFAVVNLAVNESITFTINTTFA
jgi:microcompartment protein CcmK/EutM